MTAIMPINSPESVGTPIDGAENTTLWTVVYGIDISTFITVTKTEDLTLKMLRRLELQRLRWHSW